MKNNSLSDYKQTENGSSVLENSVNESLHSGHQQGVFNPPSNSLPREEIPGPPVNPSTKDNIHDINQAGNLANFQLDQHQKYGQTLQFFPQASQPAISTTNQKLLHECSKLSDKPKSLYHFLDPLIGNLMFLPPGEMDDLRKLFINKFSSNLFKENYDSLLTLIENETDLWIKEPTIKIQSKFNALAMKITIKLVCGEVCEKSEQLAGLIHNILQESLNLQYKKEGASEQKLGSLVEEFFKVINTLIDQRSKKKDSKNNLFLNDVLNYTKDEVKQKGIIALTLMGSYHTIGSALSWMFYALATYPEVRTKVYQEIASDKDLNYNQLSRLKYTKNVLMETLRVYPPGPYTARQSSATMQADQYVIEPGTIIFFPILALHHNPAYWNEPDKFDPDRFSKPYTHNAYMPYGHGKRNCPGATMANLIILGVTAKILKHVDVIKVNNKPEMHECFVLTSKNDIELVISPRTKTNPTSSPTLPSRTTSFNIICTLATMLVLCKIDRTLALIFVVIILGKHLHKSNHSFFNKLPDLLAKDSPKNELTSLPTHQLASITRV